MSTHVADRLAVRELGLDAVLVRLRDAVLS
jgi:hypothetical protein